MPTKFVSISSNTERHVHLDDIKLNFEPVNRLQNKDYKFNVFKSKGFHFIHLDINNLLDGINELHYVAKSSNAAVIGISATNLDNAIHDSQVARSEYWSNLTHFPAPSPKKQKKFTLKNILYFLQKTFPYFEMDADQL